MSSEKEIIVSQKAAMFDLRVIVKNDSKETYTKEDLYELFDKYIQLKEQVP